MHVLYKYIEPTSKLHSAGDIVAIMEVFVRPPRESCNSLVNLLSLLVQKGRVISTFST